LYKPHNSQLAQICSRWAVEQYRYVYLD